VTHDTVQVNFRAIVDPQKGFAAAAARGNSYHDIELAAAAVSAAALQPHPPPFEQVAPNQQQPFPPTQQHLQATASAGGVQPSLSEGPQRQSGGGAAVPASTQHRINSYTARQVQESGGGSSASAVAEAMYPSATSGYTMTFYNNAAANGPNESPQHWRSGHRHR
jgi:hypothetical protein